MESSRLSGLAPIVLFAISGCSACDERAALEEEAASEALEVAALELDCPEGSIEVRWLDEGDRLDEAPTLPTCTREQLEAHRREVEGNRAAEVILELAGPADCRDPEHPTPEPRLVPDSTEHLYFRASGCDATETFECVPHENGHRCALLDDITLVDD